MDSQTGTQRRSIVVSGPLAPFADGLRADAAGRGYAADTIGDHVHLLADLSGWLDAAGLAATELTSCTLDAFLVGRRAAGCRTGLTLRGWATVLDYLRRLDVVPPVEPLVTAATLLESVLSDYQRHLVDERGMSASTVRHYLRCANRFMASLPMPLEVSLPALSGDHVIGYVVRWSTARAGAPVDMTTLPALRSLLRFLHYAGHVDRALSSAVPAGRRRPTVIDLPKAARAEYVQAVLAGCDRRSAVGRRNYAILLMLARLAVRGGEVARLELSDVNWRAGEVTIRGKGGRVDRLPLPTDVGAAMADYLLQARPATRARTVFVTVKAPFEPMAVSTVTVMAAACCARVNVPRFGPHGVRHAAACGLLAEGASMVEIGQLLRHAQERTTKLYAKLDTARLRELALPCPQGAPR